MTRLPLIREAALIAESGLDAMRFLTTTDQVELMTMQAIARSVMEQRAEAMKD
jgi:hypothetical protein